MMTRRAFLAPHLYHRWRKTTAFFPSRPVTSRRFGTLPPCRVTISKRNPQDRAETAAGQKPATARGAFCHIRVIWGIANEDEARFKRIGRVAHQGMEERRQRTEKLPAYQAAGYASGLLRRFAPENE
jgi:hypothetical protein